MSSTVRSLPRSSEVQEFELSFLGVCVPRDSWQAAFGFYTDTLGVACHSRDGKWAVLGAGWAPYVEGRSRGLVWELFERVDSPPPVDSESNAALTPVVRLRNPASTIDVLAGSGVRYHTRVGPHGTNLAFNAPGGTAWELRSHSAAHADASLKSPEILEVNLRVEDTPRQIEFYRRLLGTPRRSVHDSATATSSSSPRGASWEFQPHSDGPVLRLTSGGRRHRRSSAAANSDPALAQPVFLGFMAQDLVASVGRLKAAGVEVLRDVTHHDWGGTDCILADADGNAVQVFTLDSEHAFGSAKR